MNEEEIFKKIENALFLDEEGEVEHVDMSYKELMDLLHKLAE